jgi:hypothetical protein
MCCCSMRQRCCTTMGRSCACSSTSTSRWVPSDLLQSAAASYGRISSALRKKAFIQLQLACIAYAIHLLSRSRHILRTGCIISMLHMRWTKRLPWKVASLPNWLITRCKMMWLYGAMQDNWVVAWAPGASADLAWEWANYKVSFGTACHERPDSSAICPPLAEWWTADVASSAQTAGANLQPTAKRPPSWCRPPAQRSAALRAPGLPPHSQPATRRRCRACRNS